MQLATSMLSIVFEQGVSNYLSTPAHPRLAQHCVIKQALQSQVSQITERCERHVARQEKWRILRAEVDALERKVSLAPRNETVEVPRQARRPVVVKRSDPLAAIKEEIAKVRRAQRAVDARIVAARQVLVGEAAAVMGLKRWEIAGLALPPVKELRRESG